MAALAKTQGVEIRNRACAHAEDIPQNAANSRCGALVRLDVARVVVAFHFEGGAKFAGQPDNACILAWTDNDVGAFGRKALEVYARALVTAVFAPHS